MGQKPCSRDTKYLPELYITRIDIKCLSEFPDGDKPGLAFSPLQSANGADGDSGCTGQVGLAHDLSDPQFF